MKTKVVAQDKEHLMELIQKEIKLNGFECDLNHIDVSKVIEMMALFQYSKFNGNISQWDVSNVTNMGAMFLSSMFNGDVSNWDVSNVDNMYGMFYESRFNGDVSNWKPLKITSITEIFANSSSTLPYWGKIENTNERNKAIHTYHLNKELSQELTDNGVKEKKLKI